MVSYSQSCILRPPSAERFFSGGAVKATKGSKAGKGLSSLIASKGAFLSAVFATLIAQLAFTFYVMYYMRSQPALEKSVHDWFLAIFLAQIAIIFILALVPMPMAVKLLPFTVFSGLFGMVLSGLNRIPQEVINTALIATTGVFVAMFVVGLVLATAGIDLSWMGSLLLAALIGLVIAQTVMLFVKVSSLTYKLVLYFGLALFSVYVVFHTNTLLNDNNPNMDFVTAAMDYYLDFLNIFVRIVDVMNGN